MIPQEVLICSIPNEYCISSMIFKYVHISYLLNQFTFIVSWLRKQNKTKQKTPTSIKNKIPLLKEQKDPNKYQQKSHNDAKLQS